MLRNINTLRDSTPRPLLGRGKVFVVNEDRGDLAHYRAMLQRTGWRVVTCGSYPEAMVCLESEPFDLVVVSQGGCAFEGRPALMRAIDLNRERPVVVVTRSLDIGCYLEAMRLGAADYMEEPVSEEEISRAAASSSRFRTAAA